MNQTYPAKVRAMLSRIELIKTDLSEVSMSISLDGNVKDLPETKEILSSITTENKQQLVTALNLAFTQQDLARVNALYSYVVLFAENDQAEIRQEAIRGFILYIGEQKNEVKLNAMFLHPGFVNLITHLNDKELTDLQFKLFSRYHLDDKTPVGRRIAGIQKNLPLSEAQKAEVVNYLDEIKAEKEQVEKKKDNTKTIIIVVLSVVLLIIRFALRMHNR